MRRLLALAAALALAAPVTAAAPSPAVAAGGTSVSGILTGDLHWTVAGSPYTFADHVTLAEGATLVIDPGVTVDGNGKYWNVAGVVTATGTPIDPIVVYHAVGPTFFPTSGGSAFAWTEFRQGYSYLRPDQYAYGPLPALSHVWFNGGDGLYMYYPKSGSVTTTYTFADARFTNGADLNGCCSSWSASRVSVEGGTVANVLSYTLGVSITNSNILRPGTGVCSGGGASCALTTFTGTQPISATGVWWGTADRAAINASILDGLDDPTHPVVALDPVRSEPLDLVGPTSAITSAWVDTAAGSLLGTALDDPVGASGVASVEASVRDTVTGEWWTGSAWGGTEAWLPAAGTGSWSLALPPLVEGRSYVARSHAVDVAGNPQWGTVRGAFTTDGDLPWGSFYIEPDGPYVRDTDLAVYFQAGDGTSGIAAYRLSLDGVHWATAPYTRNDLTVDMTDPAIGGDAAQGAHTLRMAFADGAGHWSPVVSEVFILDSVPPTGSVTVNGGAAVTASLVVPVAAIVDDATTWAYPLLSNDGTTWAQPAGSSWNLSAGGGSTAPGSHTVWWKLADAAGNETAPVAVEILFDASAPKVTTPSVPRFLSPQTAGSSAASLRFTWSGTDDAGIAGYQVERSVNGGSYAAIATPATGSLTTSAAYGKSVRYRVRAIDLAGRASGWAYTTTVKPVLVQQTSGSIAWRGTWRTASSGSYLGGSSRAATIKGASATLRFTARSIAWVATRGSTRGSAKVYIDGAYATTVSLYSASGSYRQVVYARAWSSRGTHTIRIVVAGTSGHPKVDLDAFLRLD